MKTVICLHRVYPRWMARTRTLFDMLPHNNEDAWWILYSGRQRHKGIADGGRSDCLFTDHHPTLPRAPGCNLLSNMRCYLCGIGILAGRGWMEWEREERKNAQHLWRLWRVGRWGWSLYELFTLFPEYWPAHRPVLFQIGGRSPETGVQMRADKPSLYPLFLSSSLWTSLPRTGVEKRKKKKTQQDRDESHIVCRAEFGRPQIKDSGRLVMIRGLGWVMGSKDDHLFPSLPIQRERKKEAQRHGGGWHIPSAKHTITVDNRSILQWFSPGNVQTNVCTSLTVKKDGPHESSPSSEAKISGCPLVAGSRIGLNPPTCMQPNGKNPEWKSNPFFSKVFSVILSSSKRIDECSRAI